jgi:hypothetical protein
MNNEKKDNLIESFRKRLNNYERPLADIDSAWAKLEQDLSDNKRKKRALFWKIAIPAAAVIALLICLPLALKEHNNIQKTPITENTNTDTTNNIVDKTATGSSETDRQQPEDNEQASGKDDNSRIPSPSNKEATANRCNTGKSKGKSQTKKDSDTKEDSPHASSLEPDSLRLSDKNAIADSQKPVSENTHEEKTSTDSKPDNKTDSKPDDKSVRQNSNMLFPDEKSKTKAKGKGFSFSFALGNSPMTDNGNRVNSDYILANEPAGYDLSSDQLLPRNAIEQINTEVKYGVPVSVALAVRKKIANRWALESGLVYTLLTSTETGNSIKKNTSLHYLGIPLKASFALIESGRFSSYISAGGMGEICVYGKETYDTGIIDLQKLDVSGIQWSVFGGLGLDYKLAGPLHIFAEPGMIYYFNDGNSVKTVRKSVPLNFNLQVGLRLTY